MPRSTVGKTEKSSVFCVLTATSRTITDIAILKVKNTSNAKAGSGNTIIARIIMIKTGAANCEMFILAMKFCIPTDEAAIYAASGISSAGTGRSRGGTG